MTDKRKGWTYPRATDRREVTAVVRHGDGRATIFGKDWNATIKGDEAFIDYLERSVPGVLIDIVPSEAGFVPGERSTT